jgi:hypothetical protein
VLGTIITNVVTFVFLNMVPFPFRSP